MPGVPAPLRATLYEVADRRVDVKARPLSRLARVRLWSGGRWPRLERSWRARLRPWIPWYSLETQALRAILYLCRSGGHPEPDPKTIGEAMVRVRLFREDLAWHERHPGSPG